MTEVRKKRDVLLAFNFYPFVLLLIGHRASGAARLRRLSMILPPRAGRRLDLS
jgi:hypothetical protein